MHSPMAWEAEHCSTSLLHQTPQETLKGAAACSGMVSSSLGGSSQPCWQCTRVGMAQWQPYTWVGAERARIYPHDKHAFKQLHYAGYHAEWHCLQPGSSCAAAVGKLSPSPSSEGRS